MIHENVGNPFSGFPACHHEHRRLAIGEIPSRRIPSVIVARRLTPISGNALQSSVKYKRRGILVHGGRRPQADGVKRKVKVVEKWVKLPRAVPGMLDFLIPIAKYKIVPVPHITWGCIRLYDDNQRIFDS